jgi:hypothetical protein
MKDPYQIIQEAEVHLDSIIEWQVRHGVTSNYRHIAESIGNAANVFTYAAILYPKFIKVEGAVVLEDHYTAQNWKAWREQADPFASASVINHVHIEDYLVNDYAGQVKLQRQLGELLAFFWQMAVDRQFPEDKVTVQFDGDVIHIFQHASGA